MKLRNVFGILLSLFALVIVGCGGGDSVTPADPNAPATVTVTSSAASAQVNNALTITANVKKTDGTAVADGTVVTFTTTFGTLSAVTTTTGGNATATLNSASAGAATVTATAGGIANTVAVTFVINQNLPFSVTVTGAATANIGTSVVLTATVTPAGTLGAGGGGGVIADGTVVTFTTTSGTITASATTTGGVATATLSGIAAPATATITAATGGKVSPAKTVSFIDPNAAATITVTRTPATGFINSPVTITANVVRVAGGPVPVGTTVNFTATAGGTLSAATAITNAGGNATVTLNSAAAGTVTVTATVAPATGSLGVIFAAAPTKAIVKIATSGTLPAGGTIDGVTLNLNYVLTKGLSIVDAGVVVSGATTANLVVPNTTVAGQVIVAYANANAAPIQTAVGEFTTLTFSIAANTPAFIPVIGDFTINAASTVATTPVLATPLTVTVLSVTLQ